MRDKKHVFKRGLSLFLALTMCLGLLQVTAFAAAGEECTHAHTSVVNLEDGHHAYKCDDCKKVVSDPVFHNWKKESTWSSPAQKWTCEDCGETVLNDVVMPPKEGVETGHSHIRSDNRNLRTKVVAPTCTAAGYSREYCVFCATAIGEPVPGDDALGHMYGSPEWTWTGYTSATATFKCTREGCGEKKVVPAQITSETAPAYCGTEGNVVYTAHITFEEEEYSDSKEESLAALTHACDKAMCWEYNNTEHWKSCTNFKASDTLCNEKFEVGAHQYNLNEGTKCLCGAEKPSEPEKPCLHSPDPTEWVKLNADRHCRACIYCGKLLTTYTLAHKWVEDDGRIPVTCTQDGHKTFTCSDCQATKEVTTPALAHKYGEYTEKGTGHAKQCSVCGDYTPMEPHEYVDGVCVKCGAKKPVQPVEPCEHKWMWKDNKDGTHTFHCGLCGVDDADFVNEPHKFIGGECDKCGAKEPEQGHTHEFTVHVATASVPATCETVGKDVYKCKVAGCTERWTFDLAPLGHDFSGEPVITESTEGCMKGGVKTWTCQRQGCDATKEEPVDAQVSHTYGDKIAEKPAACEVPGMKAHYECEVCGKLFIGTHEVSAEDLEIPALEHSFTDYVPDNNGSCTAAGTETAVCDNGCGKTDTRTAAGTGEGHTVVVDAAVAPTCTEAGLTEGRHCSACGEVLAKQEVVEAAGHQYDDGVTVTVPDCNHAGATRFTCEVCGDSYEEADSPFGHEVVSYASVAATCTANGYTGGSYCSRCGSVITARTVVPAVGHSWNAGVVTTQPTYYNTGVRTYTCARDASHTYTETIPALTYPGGGGGGSYNPVTPVTPVTPNVPVTPNNPVNIPDANVPQGSTPDGLTTIEDENTPLGGITFVDVTPTDWFYDAVQYVFEKGLMLGVSDTEFGPNLSTTRGMIVTILYRMEGEPEAAAAPFTDVEPGLWYSNAIGWGAANDIVNGYGDGRFGPNDQITREQMAAIFYRYAQYKGYDVTARADLSGYADADQISEYAVEAMQWAVGVKLVNGLTADTLVPKGQATRAQVATMLMRFDQEIAAA